MTTKAFGAARSEEGSTLVLAGNPKPRKEPVLVYADHTFQSPGRPAKKRYESGGGGNPSAKLRELRMAGDQA